MGFRVRGLWPVLGVGGSGLPKAHDTPTCGKIHGLHAHGLFTIAHLQEFPKILGAPPKP